MASGEDMTQSSDAFTIEFGAHPHVEDGAHDHQTPQEVAESKPVSPPDSFG